MKDLLLPQCPGYRLFGKGRGKTADTQCHSVAKVLRAWNNSIRMEESEAHESEMAVVA
jgi:hypothetical protein